jgi:predicted component of type VI protein secretion system
MLTNEDLKNIDKAIEQRLEPFEQRLKPIETRLETLETKLGGLETKITEGFKVVDDVHEILAGHNTELEQRVARLDERVDVLPLIRCAERHHHRRRGGHRLVV